MNKISNNLMYLLAYYYSAKFYKNLKATVTPVSALITIKTHNYKYNERR